MRATKIESLARKIWWKNECWNWNLRFTNEQSINRAIFNFSVTVLDDEFKKISLAVDRAERNMFSIDGIVCTEIVMVLVRTSNPSQLHGAFLLLFCFTNDLGIAVLFCIMAIIKQKHFNVRNRKFKLTLKLIFQPYTTKPILKQQTNYQIHLYLWNI